MKKFSLLTAFAAIIAAGSFANEPELPTGFDPSEWKYEGVGIYTYGVYDWLQNEFNGNTTAEIWQSTINKGDYLVLPGDVPFDESKGETIDTYMRSPGPFQMHTSNPEQVWCDCIYVYDPLIFGSYQQVPEVLGMHGDAKYYGKLKDGKVTFPAESFICTSLPTQRPVGNINGNAAVTLPITSEVKVSIADYPHESVYYNLHGVRVENPQNGVYILVTGGKKCKVRL